MQKIIALALLVASLGAVPVLSTSAQAVEAGIAGHCGPDAPESYKRPGGFCEQVGSNKSLVEPQEADCYWYVPLASLEAQETVKVADNCYVWENIL